MTETSIVLDDPPPEGWAIVDSLVISRCIDDNGQPEFWISTRESRAYNDILGDLHYARIRLETAVEQTMYDWYEE
jgi:hypothetical protein